MSEKEQNSRTPHAEVKEIISGAIEHINFTNELINELSSVMEKYLEGKYVPLGQYNELLRRYERLSRIVKEKDTEASDVQVPEKTEGRVYSPDEVEIVSAS